MLLPSERLITNFVHVVQLQRPMFRLTANLGRVLARTAPKETQRPTTLPWQEWGEVSGLLRFR